MGIVFRQSVKTTIVTFVGALLGVVVVFMSVHVFSKQEVGVVNNIINQGAVAQLFILLGTSVLLNVYVSRYPPGDPKHKVLITFCFIIPVIAVALLSIPYFIFREKIIGIYNIKDHFYIDTFYNFIPIYVLIWGYMTLIDSYLWAQMKIALSTFMREILLRICNIILLIFFSYNILTFRQFTISSIFIYLVPTATLLFIAMRTEGFGFSFNWRIFSKEEYKDMLHYTWYHLLLITALNLMGYIDQLMLAPLDKNGLESLAVYRVALLVISFTTIPGRAMATAVFPMLNKEYITNDMPKVKQLFQRAGINMLIVSLIMFALIGCNLSNLSLFINVIAPGKGYSALIPITLILMLGRLVDVASGLNNELTSISKHYKFNFRSSLLLLILVIILDRLLIPRYGIYGAAWAATISFVGINILKMLFLWWKIGIQPFTGKTLLVVIAGAATWIAGYFLPVLFANPIYDAIVRSLLILLVYGIMLIWLRPSPDLTAYLGAIRSDKKLF